MGGSEKRMSTLGELAGEALRKQMLLLERMCERDKVISALENCIADPKCRDCPWEECEEEHKTVKIPLSLAEKALEFLKEEIREV
jgi:hypothetical protein